MPASFVAVSVKVFVPVGGTTVTGLWVTGPGTGERRMPRVAPVDAAVEVGVADAAHARRRGRSGIDLPEAAAVGGRREPLAARRDAQVAHFDQRQRSGAEPRPRLTCIDRAVEAELGPHIQGRGVV